MNWEHIQTNYQLYLLKKTANSVKTISLHIKHVCFAGVIVANNT